MLCDKTIPGETQLSPVRGLTAEQGTHGIQDQPGEPMSFWGVTYESMSEGVTGSEMTEKTAALPWLFSFVGGLR